ncbi:NAD(P)-binding domain-containing protein [Kineosporia rhizophila]|nr:NAD(P)-binding domain-containing protein [Kineosporia rhizophila]MCE0538238.1 NAD(P)-binding domain-containing protein [Kineosporia rhizophila]
MRVCVVGAGPCGLTTVKQLRDEGHEVVCFDQNADLGGIWLREGDDGTKTKAFDHLRLTISMRLMAYSDFPFKGGRKFFTRQQYLDYLVDYAQYFGLDELIRFGSEVRDIRREAGGYLVTTRREGVESTERFDAVAICSGPFKTPNRDIPELAGFTGEIVHSAEYRNAERFRGKRVLVVGLAESGADIVREVGDSAAATTLAIRSYSYLLPRIVDDHRTTDNLTTRSHHYEMYDRATRRPLVYQTFWGRNRFAKAFFGLVSVVLGLVSALGEDVDNVRNRFRPGRRKLQPLNPMGESIEPEKMDLGTVEDDTNWILMTEWNEKSHPDGSWSPRRIFCKNVSFLPSIASGKVVVNDAGLARSEGSTVHFRDGASAEYDAVVLCTGYHRDLRVGDLDVEDGNVRNLYKALPAPRPRRQGRLHRLRAPVLGRHPDLRRDAGPLLRPGAQRQPAAAEGSGQGDRRGEGLGGVLDRAQPAAHRVPPLPGPLPRRPGPRARLPAADALADHQPQTVRPGLVRQLQPLGLPHRRTAQPGRRGPGRPVLRAGGTPLVHGPQDVAAAVHALVGAPEERVNPR